MKQIKNFRLLEVALIVFVAIGVTSLFFIKTTSQEEGIDIKQEVESASTTQDTNEGTTDTDVQPTPVVVREELEFVGLPACNVADSDRHLFLANNFITAEYPSYTLDVESEMQVGPCNNGNTAWTQFNVRRSTDGGIVGHVTVNGDTEEVSFELFIHKNADFIIASGACGALEFRENLGDSFEQAFSVFEQREIEKHNDYGEDVYLEVFNEIFIEEDVRKRTFFSVRIKSDGPIYAVSHVIDSEGNLYEINWCAD